MRMFLAAALVAVLCSGAHALEPGHPNAILCIEKTFKVSVTAVSFREDQIESVELVRILRKDHKECRGKKANDCRALGGESYRVRKLDLGIPVNERKARKELANMRFRSRSDLAPRGFWNARELDNKIAEYFKKTVTKQHRGDLHAEVEKRLPPLGSGKKLYGTVRHELPIGELELEAKMMGILKGGSLDYSFEFYFMEMK